MGNEITGNLATRIRTAQTQLGQGHRQAAGFLVQKVAEWMTSSEGANTFGNKLGDKKLNEVAFVSGITNDDPRIRNSSYVPFDYLQQKESLATIQSLIGHFPNDQEQKTVLKLFEDELKAQGMVVLGYHRIHSQALIAFDAPKEVPVKPSPSDNTPIDDDKNWIHLTALPER